MTPMVGSTIRKINSNFFFRGSRLSPLIFIYERFHASNTERKNVDAANTRLSRVGRIKFPAEPDDARYIPSRRAVVPYVKGLMLMIRCSHLGVPSMGNTEPERSHIG